MLQLLYPLFLLISSSSLACEVDPSFPCSASTEYYSISVDAVQTTFAKRDIHITIDEDAPDGIVHIKNNSPFSLYTISNKKISGAPNFSLQGKSWYVQTRFTDSGDTSCQPANAVPEFLKNSDKVKWDCTERDLCGEISNPNEAIVPENGYPREWLTSGLITSAIPYPKKAESAYTQYFLYRGEIKILTVKSIASINEDYLQVSCDDGGTVDECDQSDCAYYLNHPKAADKIDHWSSVEISMADEKLSDLFDLEIYGPADYASRLAGLNPKIAQAAQDTLNEIDGEAQLEKLPTDYLAYRIAAKIYSLVNPALAKGPWKLKLQRNSTPATPPRQPPAASPPKSE